MASSVRSASRKQPSGGKTTLVPRGFYRDPPDFVARKLLGKLLVRKVFPIPSRGSSREIVGRIVEVEGYFGDADPAAHTFAGKTARTAVLFGPPGHAYVYFIYGMYYCLNISCEPEGHGGGVLIRALEPIAGLDLMAGLRRLSGKVKADDSFANPVRNAMLTSGPGRLCQAFGITRERDNGADLTSRESDLQIQDDGFVAAEVLVTPRIGIRKAIDRPARFVIAGNPYVSGGLKRNT